MADNTLANMLASMFGYAEPTKLTPAQEESFQKAWKKLGWKGSPPDVGQGDYDNRGAWQAGQLAPYGQHSGSGFKLPGHPNEFIRGDALGWGQPMEPNTVFDTKTGSPANLEQLLGVIGKNTGTEEPSQLSNMLPLLLKLLQSRQMAR